MSWIGDKCVFPSPEVKNEDNTIQWTQEGGLTLFQYCVIQITAGMMPQMSARYEEDALTDLAIDQTKSLLRKIKAAEEELRAESEDD